MHIIFANLHNSIIMFSLKNRTYSLVGFEPRSSALQAGVMTVATRHQFDY
jgi:hypothetical protein